MSKYKALIIGAGQVAGGYDDLQSENILTHAHAYHLQENIELKGFYDIDPEKASLMAKKWNTKAIKTFDNINDIDIVSICTPNNCHLKSIQQSLKLNPRVILLEKPLSDNEDDAKKILEISRTTPILVNYSRRFCPEFEGLASQIKNGEFGKYQTGSGYYGKGFVHNGSHMIDLINMLLGEIKNRTEITQLFDFHEKDPSKSIIQTLLNNKKFYMQAVDCNNYTVFELDLFFESGRIKILNSGFEIEFHSIKENDNFKGYKSLCFDKVEKTGLNKYMMYVINNIYEYLTNNAKLKITPKEAINYV